MYKEEVIEEIMDYWFGDIQVADLPGNERTALWFGGSDEIDTDIRERFGDILEEAIDGALDEWAEAARGRLALIILLDQFSRNIFRNSSRAFLQDEQSLALCFEGIQKKQDHELALIQRVFFYMPLEHAESIDMQERSVQAFQGLANIAMPETAGVYQAFLKYAVMHYDVVKQFGRFPHRNHLLDRNSTEAETLFIAQSND